MGTYKDLHLIISHRANPPKTDLAVHYRYWLSRLSPFGQIPLSLSLCLSLTRSPLAVVYPPCLFTSMSHPFVTLQLLVAFDEGCILHKSPALITASWQDDSEVERGLANVYSNFSNPRESYCTLEPPVPFSYSSLQSLRWTAEFHFISYIIPVLSFVPLLANPPLIAPPPPSLSLFAACQSRAFSLPTLCLSLLHLSISMRHSSSLHLAQRRLLPLRLSFARSRSRSAGYGMYASECAPVYMHACIWDRLCCLWTVAVSTQPWEFSERLALAVRNCVLICFFMYSLNSLRASVVPLWSALDVNCTLAEWDRQI